MATLYNRFSVLEHCELSSNEEPSTPLSEDESTEGKVRETPFNTPDCRRTSRVVPNAPKKKSPKSWADYSDEDEDEPIPFSLSEENIDIKQDCSQASEEKATPVETPVMSEQDKAQQKAFDILLSKVREIKVPHSTKTFDEKTGTFLLQENIRTFRVVSQNYYDGLKRLIGLYKTHKKNLFNRSEQYNKIKLANELMQVAYKNPNIPCCFVYPVVIIRMDGDRSIVRNEVNPGSSCYFYVSDKEYYPPNNTQPTGPSS